MDISNLDVFRIGRQKLQYLGSRQAVLALNISNADTPNYRARDVKAPEFHSMLSMGARSINMRRTDGAHMDTHKMQSAFKIHDRTNPLSERNPNNNTVNIDEEIQKVAMTQAEYNKVISIYRKNISIFKTAVQGQG